ncbi:MAG: hypothetical protein WDZ59_09500 [Pirellulales bacterium]
MKRLILRLAVLSIVVALGLIAIAQARYGRSDSEKQSEQTEATDSPETLPKSPSPAPGAIADDDGETKNPFAPPADARRLPSESDEPQGVETANLQLSGGTDRYAESHRPMQQPQQLAVQAGGADSDIPSASSLEQSTTATDQLSSNSPQGSNVRQANQINENPYRQNRGEEERYTAPPASAAFAEDTTAPELAGPSFQVGLGGRPNPMARTAAIGAAATGQSVTDASGATGTLPEVSGRQPAESTVLSTSNQGQFVPSDELAGSNAAVGEPEHLLPAADVHHAQPLPAADAANDFTADASYGQPSAQSGFAPAAGTDGTGRPGAKKLEGPQIPTITVTKIAPPEIQVGKECRFTIQVRNDGEVPAHNLLVYDTVPEGTQLLGTSPQATETPDGQLVWEQGTLEPGGEITLEMRLQPHAEGEIGSVARVQFETQASARVTATKPELNLKVSDSRPVMIGEDVLLKIDISNPGSGPATGVLLLYNVPLGVRHPSGQALEFEVGTLAPGETRELDLVLTAEQEGRIDSVLTAKADAGLRVDSQFAVEVVAPGLDVTVEGPAVRYLDRQAVYTVGVANPGTADAQDVELVTYLPKGMKFVRANNHGQYDEASHAVYWGLDALPAKDSGSVELVTLPVEAGEQILRIEGKADRGLLREARQTVSVKGLVAIRFEVVDVQDPIEVGGETEYEIRVVNQGTKEATNVTVVAIAPPGMQLLSGEGPGASEIQGNQLHFEPLRKLAPKADVTYRAKIKGIQPGDQRLVVQVRTDEVTDPVTKEESTQVYGDQ